MSNQVFANTVSRFYPNSGQVDKLTLKKTNPPIGYISKVIDVSGTNLNWNVLNGTQITDTASIINSQNYATKPYWNIAPGGATLDNALILVSVIDNLIAVNADVPFWLQTGSVLNGGFVKLVACVLDPNNNYSILSTSGLAVSPAISTSTASIAALTTPLPGGLSLSTVVEVKAGQVLTVRAYYCYPTDYTQQINMVMQDDAMNSSPTALVTECFVTFQKI